MEYDQDYINHAISLRSLPEIQTPDTTSKPIKPLQGTEHPTKMQFSLTTIVIALLGTAMALPSPDVNSVEERAAVSRSFSESLFPYSVSFVANCGRTAMRWRIRPLQLGRGLLRWLCLLHKRKRLRISSYDAHLTCECLLASPNSVTEHVANLTQARDCPTVKTEPSGKIQHEAQRWSCLQE